MENITNTQNDSQKSYDWIVNAINSSNNPFHIECCKKLIELYMLRFPDEKWNREAELLLIVYQKENEINFF
jgi:hypothetical protein